MLYSIGNSTHWTGGGGGGREIKRGNLIIRDVCVCVSYFSNMFHHEFRISYSRKRNDNSSALLKVINLLLYYIKNVYFSIWFGAARRHNFAIRI